MHVWAQVPVECPVAGARVILGCLIWVLRFHWVLLRKDAPKNHLSSPKPMGRL